MENRIYNKELGLDGTLEELIDWAYRYSDDYTDEALDEITAKAREFGLPEEQAVIPTLIKLDRQRTERKDGTLPYEQMKLDVLRGGLVSYSSTEVYGEVEIRQEGDKVLVSVIRADDKDGSIAAGVCSVEEFMAGEGNFLESLVGQVMFYGAA